MHDDEKIAPFPRTGDAATTAAPSPEPGQIEMIVTYLQREKAPSVPHRRSRAEPVAIMRARHPTVSFYRYLYDTVGEPWMWYERRRLSDDALAAIVQHERVSVNVLYCDGVPAGYVELDLRVEGEIELAYFGLIPEFIGRGLGQYFLDWAVDAAWSYQPRRVWVHTCNFDHPNAMAVYQKAGFVVYDQQRDVIDDPRIG